MTEQYSDETQLYEPAKTHRLRAGLLKTAAALGAVVGTSLLFSGAYDMMNGPSPDKAFDFSAVEVTHPSTYPTIVADPVRNAKFLAHNVHSLSSLGSGIVKQITG